MRGQPDDRLTSRQAAHLAGLSYHSWQSDWLIRRAVVRRPAADGVFPDTSLPYWKRSTVERFVAKREKPAKQRDKLHAAIVRENPQGLREKERLAARLSVTVQTIYRHQLRHAVGECPCTQARSA